MGWIFSPISLMHSSDYGSDMGPTRIVLAEDNLLVREGLLSLLGTTAEIEVVAACASLPELLDAVGQHEPDLVLTDIRMPPTHNGEGVEAARRLRTSHPDLGVVVVSQYAEPEYVLAVLGESTRGRGYVLKDRIEDLDHLLEAINAVRGGGSFIDDQVIQVLIRARTRVSGSPVHDLTRREQEVLAEIATGRSNKAIAAQLEVSVPAIEKHTNAIFAKLGLEEGAEVNRRVKAVLLFLAGQPQSA